MCATAGSTGASVFFLAASRFGLVVTIVFSLGVLVVLRLVFVPSVVLVVGVKVLRLVRCLQSRHNERVLECVRFFLKARLWRTTPGPSFAVEAMVSKMPTRTMDYYSIRTPLGNTREPFSFKTN